MVTPRGMEKTKKVVNQKVKEKQIMAKVREANRIYYVTNAKHTAIMQLNVKTETM